MSSEREWVSSGAGWVSSARLHTSICVLVQSDTGGHQSWSQRPEKPIKRSRWRRGLVWVAVDRAEAAKRTLIAASAATVDLSLGRPPIFLVVAPTLHFATWRRRNVRKGFG